MGKKVEDQRASDKETKLTSEILQKTEDIEALQQEQKKQGEIIEYAAKVANSPRIKVEWVRENVNDPYRIKITNNDTRTFKEVRIVFSTKYRIFADKMIVKETKDPLYEEAISKDGISFVPGSTIEAEVPMLNHNLENQPRNYFSGEKIETDVIITLDEFVSIRDDVHSIKLTTWINRNNDFKPQYVTTTNQPLFIHREVKYMSQSRE